MTLALSFKKNRLQVGQPKPYGVFLGLVHTKTIAYLLRMCSTWLKPCSGKYVGGNSSSNNNLTFPQTSEKRSFHLIQKSDHLC